MKGALTNETNPEWEASAWCQHIIDMLLFFGYIIQASERHYQRTHKKPSALGVDAFHTATEPAISSIQPITDYFEIAKIEDTTQDLRQ